MATQLFFTELALSTDILTHRGDNDDSDLATNTGSAGWQQFGLSTTRGNGVITRTRATVTGPTTGIAVLGNIGARAAEYISNPIDQNVTISGTITFNLRGLESAMTANAAINCCVYRLSAQTRAKTLIVKTANVTELGTSESANNFTASPTSTALTKGDRLLCVVFFDDSSAATMASGANVSFAFDGTTAAASGDSWIQFTENFGVLTDITPGGTVLYATATDDNVTALNDRRMWTSRGSATKILESDPAAGWMAAAPFAGSINTCYQQGSQTAAENGLRNGADWSAQSFEASGSILNSVRWFPRKDGTPTDNVLIELQADSSGNPSGTALATITVAASGITSFVVRTDNFSSPPTVTPGTTYWLVFRRSGADSAVNFISTTGFAANIYAGGVHKYTDNSGGAWSAGTLAIDLEVGIQSAEWFWLTPPLNTFTLSGIVKCNIWAGTNVVGTTVGNGLVAELAVVDNDGTLDTIFGQVAYHSPTADNLTDVEDPEEAHVMYIAGQDIVVADQQRLRLRLLSDDSANAPRMRNLSGQAVKTSVSYSGTTASASGDTWIELVQTVTEFVASTPGPGFRQRRADRFLTRR